MHIQGGAHEETPFSVHSIVDGAPGLLAEAGVDFSMVQGKVMQLKELELVEHESQDPGDISWFDGEGVIVCWDEGHVVIVKHWSWWVFL